MAQNFIIKKGKTPAYLLTLFLCLYVLYFIFWQRQIHVALLPLILFVSIAFLAWGILFFRWTISFAVFLDMEKQEIILNHSLFFCKKKISLQDIKEVDVLNGNIVLFSSAPLSKCQKMVCKTKKTGYYTVRFKIIDAYERRQLLELLSTFKSEE